MLITLLLALVLIVTFSYLQENIGLNLSDEGFLWNGVIRTSKGKIPILDFKSYDPGRYYWSAFWAKFLGLGIIGIRRSVTIFQFFGLWSGLLVAYHFVNNVFILFLVGMLLMLWMEPRWKRFDHSVSFLAVFMAVSLLENPTLLMFFVAGIFVGLAGFMGRNHGIYSFASFLVIILLNWIYSGSENVLIGLICWSIGIILGYSPMLVMWVKFPKMFKIYWHDKVANILFGGILSYMKLPIGSTRNVKNKNNSTFEIISIYTFGMFTLLFPIVYLIIFIFILVDYQTIFNPPIIAPAVVGIFYFHRAFVRLNRHGISQASQPLILTIIGLIYSFENPYFRSGILIAFLIISILAIAPLVPIFDKLVNKDKYIDYNLNDEKLYIKKSLAKNLDIIRNFTRQNIALESNIFIAPHLATLYPILNKTTPVHSDYLLFPELEKKQRIIINDLVKNSVDWIIMNDNALDDREELRFRNTHKTVWNYVQSEFEERKVHGLQNPYKIFQRIK